MGQYRYSRNIEASLIDHINQKLSDDGWTNIEVCKGFTRAYDLTVPIVCIRLSDTSYSKVEIGSDSVYRVPLIFIDIFGSSDGNRLDLKDYLVSILKSQIPYYEYTIANGTVQSKVRNGNIEVLEIRDIAINFDINKNELAVQDRFRHLLTLTTELGIIET